MNKKQMEEKTKKLSSRYSRILFLRYFLVSLFFINLYWFLMLLLSHSWGGIIPFSLLLLAGIAYSEQLKFANSTKINYLLKKNSLFFSIQSIVNIVLLLSLFNRLFFSMFFPFLNFNQQSNLVLGIILFLGLTVSLFCKKRIKDISNNRDKYYLKYEK